MRLLCAFLGSPGQATELYFSVSSCCVLIEHCSLGSQFHWHPGLCWKTKVLITWFGDKGSLLIFPRKIAIKRYLVCGVSRLPQFWNCSEHKSIPGKTTYEYRGCESWELDCLALRRNPMDSDWQGMWVHGLGLLAHTCSRGTRSRGWDGSSPQGGPCAQVIVQGNGAYLVIQISSWNF